MNEDEHTVQTYRLCTTAEIESSFSVTKSGSRQFGAEVLFVNEACKYLEKPMKDCQVMGFFCYNSVRTPCRKTRPRDLSPLQSQTASGLSSKYSAVPCSVTVEKPRPLPFVRAMPQPAAPSFALAPPLPLSSSRWRSSRRVRVCRYRLSSRSVAVAATDTPLSDDPPGPTFAPPPPPPPDCDSLLLDPEDREFVEWASAAEREVVAIPPVDDEDVPIELLTLDDAPVPAVLEDDVELTMDAEFPDDGGDEGADNDDDDEDEELAAQAGAEDYEDDIPIDTLSKRGGRISTASRMSGPLAGVDVDDNDDIDDADEILETIDDDIPPIFDGPAALEEEVHPSVPPAIEEEDEGLVEEESDEDIKSAADILSSSSLLGLGVKGGKRTDVSAVTSFAMGDVDTPPDEAALGESGDVEDAGPVLGADEDAAESKDGKAAAEKKAGLDKYRDLETSDDYDEFTLTSKSSFGRVWDLNDDNYVTITEPGQSYAYELDEEDEEDQEMSVMRRGKQGGWSGGLASYSAADLPKGSPEWVARRAYELVAQSNQVEMFKWTRRHRGPPPVIDGLYPSDPPPPRRLPRTKLQFSTPDTEASIIGTDSSATIDEDPLLQSMMSGDQDGKHALDRAVNFPCQYKFKIEGSGDDLLESLTADAEKLLGRSIPQSAFHVEPAGRYKRVEIMVDVESARQVTDLYDTLRSNPGVKYSYG